MGTWFITGTDTEVGKSVVTACLAAARPGSHAAKPVASGVEHGHGEDAELLGWAADHPPSIFKTWEEPLSPHRAAELAGDPLDLAGMLAWLDGLEGAPLLVEGVGGWRVPIHIGADDIFGVPELAARVDAPVVLVAADRLGVLNHTLLTLHAIRQTGLEVRGIVLNRGVPGDRSSKFNLDDLQMLTDVPIAVIGAVDLEDRAALARAGLALWAVLDP